MMREVTVEVLMRAKIPRRPSLSARKVSEACEEVTPVRELDDEGPAWHQDPCDLPEDLPGIADVDQQADGNDHVDGAIRDRQVSGVGCGEEDARIQPDACSGGFEHRWRRIDERDRLEPAVLVD
ncbi:MAG TPA: hypothetical protein VGK17_05125 [Propionicimonas sp.]|jgi:hypothetical protein